MYGRRGYLLSRWASRLKKQCFFNVSLAIIDYPHRDLNASSSTPIRAYLDSHNDTITSLKFQTIPNPSQPNTEPSLYLMSASTDGLINILDPSVEAEEDAIAVTFNNKASVNITVPFLRTGNAQVLYALSQDEQLAEYEIGDLEILKLVDEKEQPAQRSAEDVRAVLKCDYAIALRNLNMRDSSSPWKLTLAVGRYRE